ISGLNADVFLIGGVWVLKSLRMANFLRYEVPGVFIPDEIIERLEKASDEREEGLQIALEIIEYLLEKNYGIMLMTGNDLTIAKEILERLQ
ncbi:methylenetetrahydrofolate reductase, partial [bacterium]|nr:methylenetetrahydrofolate reductase [bacterium]